MFKAVLKAMRRLSIRIYKDPDGMYYSTINTTFRGSRKEVLKQIKTFLEEPL